MRVRDRNAFFAILGAVTVLGVGAVELEHTSIKPVWLLEGVAAVGVLFGVYMALGALRVRSWTRISASVEAVHVQYFRTVRYGDNWQVEVSYSHRPQNASGLAPIKAKETLQFHDRGQERIAAIEDKVKAGARVLIEFDSAAPASSRLVTTGQDPVFEG